MGRMRKIGGVMWTETEGGTMAPPELHGVSEKDLKALNQVYEALVAYKQVKPVLHIIVNSEWENRPVAAPFLKASLEPRSEARSMKASDDWDRFWITLD
jgi:hypothetical protein